MYMYGVKSLSPGCRASPELEVRLLSRLTKLNLELSLLRVPVSIVATLGIPLIQVKAGELYSLEGKLAVARSSPVS